MRLLGRELLLSARRRGLWTAAGLHGAVALAFLEAWGGSHTGPTILGGSFHAQLSALQRVLVMIAGPWIAARILSPGTGADTERMALLFGVDERDIRRARIAASAVWIAIYCLAALPAAILAQQMSATSLSELALAQGRLFVVGFGAALLTIAVAARADNGIVRWLTGATAALSAWLVVTWVLA